MRPEAGDVSRDALLNGRVHLWQPVKRGLRAGHDALLVACAVPRDAAGQLLDMGAGTGAVGFVAAARAPQLTVRLGEREPTLCDLLDRSVREADPTLATRLSIAELDLLAGRAAREAAGVADGTCDWVATNPPFHPHGGRLSPDPLRASALAMPDERFLIRWIQVAAACLRHGGRLVLLARPDTLKAILEGAENRFGAVSLLPIHGRDASAAGRVLVGAVRGSRAPLRLLPSFTLDAIARERLSGGEDMPSLFGDR